MLGLVWAQGIYLPMDVAQAGRTQQVKELIKCPNE